jgi:hypothetical protein
MLPEIVVIKDFEGRGWRRFLVGAAGPVAAITNADGAAAIADGRQPEFTVGFPLCDVYVDDGSIRIIDGEAQNWSMFKPRF